MGKIQIKKRSKDDTTNKGSVRKYNLTKVSKKDIEANRSNAYTYLFS